MKNMKTPSILQYIKALALLFIVSLAIGTAICLSEYGHLDPTAVYSVTGKLFIVFLVANVLLGRAMSKMKRGVALNDSLVIQDTTYAGTVAPYFILPALFNFDSVVKKVVYLKDSIKKKHTIPTMDFSGPLQPRVAVPSQSGGNLTINARTLLPADIMAYQEMNPRNFEVHWDAEDLSQTLLTRQLPATAENYIMLLLMGRSFEQFELMCWQGSVQYQNNPNVPQFNGGGVPNPYFQIQFVDGYIKRMLNDASIYAAASPVTISAINIGSALDALYSLVAINNKALLSNVQSRKRMKFLVSYNTAFMYESFLTNQPYKNNDTTEEGLNRFKGFDLVPLAGMPDNTIVFTEALSGADGNLWVGMNSVSDENFMLARTKAADETFFFKLLMKLDVNYGRSEKVFLYTTLTTASFIQ